MAILILVPAALRAFTDRKGEVEVEGATVEEAIAALAADYPDIKLHLYDDDGILRSYINLYIGETNIKSLRGLETPLNAGDTVMLIPAIAGGV